MSTTISQLVESFGMILKLICKWFRVCVCAMYALVGCIGSFFNHFLSAHLPEHSMFSFELISNQNNFVGIALFNITSFNPIHTFYNNLADVLAVHSIQCNNRLGNPFMHIARVGNLLPFSIHTIQFTIYSHVSARV